MDNFIDKSTPQREVNYAYLPDFELKYSEDDLNNLSQELSAEEEKVFEEILELEKGNDGKTDFMKELLEAAKKGTMQYLDSMTDTGDTFNHMKDNSSKLDDVEIMKSNHPTDPEVANSMQSRTMDEARLNPFDRNAESSTTGMTPKGVKILEKEVEAYKQRTKSVTKLTSKENPIHTSIESENLESLSGLRSFRIGSPIPPYPLEEIKTLYDQKVASDGEFYNQTQVSDWVRKEVNFPKVYDSMMETYGFSSRQAAKDWLAENNLTIHETSDGMIIVPQDVHNRSPHKGYCSSLAGYLTGKTSAEDFRREEIKEKIDFVRHESKERTIRAARGIGMSAMKDVLKCSIVVICEETYNEFKVTCEDKFINRMLRIFKRSWEHVKAKCIHIIKNLWTNIKGSILSEFLTALNDFFFGTFKNIFKVVRQMWGSIKNAFKIIFSKDKNISMGERMFEASKILSAGVVSIIGFSLNELIEKGLTSLSIPFASFISECLSGLFAGIMSAIVIMLFDKFKKDFMTKSVSVQKLQLESRILCIHSAQMQLSSVFLDMKMAETYNFIWQIFSYMGETYGHIQEQQQISSGRLSELSLEVKSQEERNTQLEIMRRRYNDDENF
jgi:hypothetical protein